MTALSLSDFVAAYVAGKCRQPGHFLVPREWIWHGTCEPSSMRAARVGVATVVLLSLALLGSAPTRARSRAKAAPPRGISVDMRNVNLHMTSDVTLRVRSLRGRFVPTRAGGVANLDDSASYVVAVDAGETSIDEATLNALMTEHVFARGPDHGKPPVKDLVLKVEDGLVKQKGKLDKKIDLPFSVKGAVEATPDGKIRVHAKSIKSLGLPVKGLMKLIGLEMDDMLKVEPGHGLTVDDNDFIIDPQTMLPPPHLQGRITSVRVEGNEIVQVFGDGPAKSAGRNHIYWRGGSLRFGKLTMRDTDLELIDQDQSDPFDFSVSGYNEMLVAGYSKNTPRLGLKTYMPDYDDLKAGRRLAGTPAEAAAVRRVSR